jgi:hypothetical protein
MAQEDYLPAAHKQVSNESLAQDELDDMILVNPGGRVIAVTGEHGQDLLADGGFRVASAAEAKTYNDQILSTMPEVLRRQEQQRKDAEVKVADTYMAEAAKAATVTTPASVETPSPAAQSDAPKPRSNK